jgi:hypothetical protein
VENRERPVEVTTKLKILSRDIVTIDRFRIDNWIYGVPLTKIEMIENAQYTLLHWPHPFCIVVGHVLSSQR